MKKFNILRFQVVKSGHIIEEPPIHICKAKSQGDILLCLSPSYSLHRVPQTKPAFPGMRMTGEKPFIDLNLFLLSAEFCGKSSSHSRVYFSRLKEGCVDKGLETTCCSMLKHWCNVVDRRCWILQIAALIFTWPSTDSTLTPDVMIFACHIPVL